MEKQLSRRAFLGLGATAALAAGAAGLAGCSPEAGSGANAGDVEAGAADSSGLTGAPSQFTPGFMVPPEVPAEVKEDKDCDVLVIGLGLSGCAAAKAATEEGAKVIAVEKAAALSAVSMACDFGVVGSQIQKELGIEWAGKDVIVNQLMKDMCYRPTPDFLGYWYDHSGEDFDWLVEGADFEVLTSTAANQQTDKVDLTTTSAIRLLLDRAATVEEAVELLRGVDMHASANSCYHFHIADANGGSVVVEYIGDEMSVIDSRLATNFLLTPGEWDFGGGQDRYDTIAAALSRNGGVFADKKAAMDVLAAARQEPKEGKRSTTQWSCVYDQRSASVEIAMDMQYDQVYAFFLN